MTSDQAKELSDRFESLKGLRSPWTGIWDEIAKYVMPRRAPGMNGTVSSPSTADDALLFDTTAVRANMTLANGQLAWMSPLESSWFGFSARKANDEAKRWLSDATAEIQRAMATSNAYLALHEFYLDRSAFGTACLYIEPTAAGGLNFQVWPVGSFVIDEDDNGQVDTVYREFKMTVRQLVMRFGIEGVSEAVRKKFQAGGKDWHEKIDLIHAIYPRLESERDPKKIDGPNKPIASVYFEKGTLHVCQVSGYDEQPFMVSRYLEWGSGLGSLYGWSPSFAATPDARQLNFLEKMGDALAEKQAFPPVLAPDELEGEIDPNANGVTYYSKDIAQTPPKEWMTAGRYDILLDRVARREKAINDAFHVDLFQMFAQLDKQMTAREVAERSSEKLIQFSPTFARLTTELFNPMLHRVFALMQRSGRLGLPPQDLQEYDIEYSSRIALALRALPTIAYQRAIERIATVAQFNSNILDNYDFDKAERETALLEGMSIDVLRPEIEVQDIRAARAQAQQQAMEAQQAMGAADAASKLGRIPNSSPVGQMIGKALPTAA